MDARRKRMLLATGGILVAIGAVVLLVRESSTPLARRDDGAGASTSADAGASARADAGASANASADAGADASTSTSAGAAQEAAEGGAARGKVVSIDEGSEGKSIELAVGQSLVAMLVANPTTGFDWAVIKAPAALGQPDLGFVSGGDRIGAPGKRRLTWTVKTALPAGDQSVELGYARSFEKGVPPFKTFTFKVRAAH
jgi:predicted secreted protein